MTEAEKERSREEVEEKIIRDREIRDRVIRRRTLKVVAAAGILTGLVTFGVLTKEYYSNHINPNQIVYELNVHNNTGLIEDGEGHRVTIDNERNCSVPYDGVNEFNDRLAKKMEMDGRYSEEDIDYIIETSNKLYSADFNEAVELNHDLSDWKKTVSSYKHK